MFDEVIIQYFTENRNNKIDKIEYIFLVLLRLRMYVKFDIIGKILLIIEFAPPVSWWKVQWGCLRMGMVPFYFQEVRMNNFKVVYRILKYLERRMDNPSATIDDLG